jgi:DNA-binding transcriptional MerR regulator
VAAPGARLTIADVARRTGIPPATIRFYERELPHLIDVSKTPGGHRRYSEADVRLFEAVRRITQERRLRLSELRRLFEGGTRPDEPKRGEEDIAGLRERIEELERRVSEIEKGGARSRGLFGRRPRSR